MVDLRGSRCWTVDAIGADGKRYQIKARGVTPWNKSQRLAGLRELAILHTLGMFVADLFKPRCRPEAL
jgi:hypothetical protein